MWSPTHVQVTVQRAKGLNNKGTNKVFVTIGLGKEKYQTSVKEKDGDRAEWHEKCELQIPKHGNTASIVLTALSQNFLGVDQFLGCVNIPLSELDVYERPKNKWYDLQDKNGKERTKDRGQLEVKIGFSVKPGAGGGNLNETTKKDHRRASLGQLSHVAHNVGGSLASIGSVDKKSFKKLAKTITRKMKRDKKSTDGLPDDVRVDESYQQRGLQSQTSGSAVAAGQVPGDADPGVISDDEFALDDLSHTGSGCSLEMAAASTGGSVETVASSDTVPMSSKDHHHQSQQLSTQHHPVQYNTMPPLKPPRSVTPIHEKFVQKWEQKLQEAKKTRAVLNKSSERIVVGGESKSTVSSPSSGRVSSELVAQYADKTREDLIELVHSMKETMQRANKEKKEMEDYIDNLLLRVMEVAPEILQNPYGSH